MVKAIIGLGSLGLGGSVMAAVAYLQFAPPKRVVLVEEPAPVVAAQPKLTSEVGAERRPNPPPLGHHPAPATRAPAQKSASSPSPTMVPCSEFSELGPTAIAGTEAGDTRSVRRLCQAPVR